MTFGQARRQIRRFRAVASTLRARVNGVRSLREMPESLTVGRSDFEALEFGLSHLKVWLPELDDEMEVIPGSGRFIRQNFLFTKTGEKREHLMFKGIPVFYEADEAC